VKLAAEHAKPCGMPPLHAAGPGRVDLRHPNPRLRIIFGANGGLETARSTGNIRGRAWSRVGRDAVLRNPNRAVWADPTHRELSIQCRSGIERGGLHLVGEINRFEKLAEDFGIRYCFSESVVWFMKTGRLNRQVIR